MKITNLEKNIGKFELYIDDLYIKPGKIHGIVGPNGCGKTVLLKMIMGIYEPDQGTINYDGLAKQEITMMSQRPYLMQTSVYKNLIYPLQIRNQVVEEDQIDGWLLRAGLLEQKKQYARSLSSGERQKLSFLRALIFRPKLVLIDETLSNLDAESEELFENIILEIQEKEPITWLIVNHQLDHIKQLCDEIHYMKKGRFIKHEIIKSGYDRDCQRKIKNSTM
ncbi:MAG: ABC transporter ATP-binding protein [Lachnospiraceae bacterium]